jgi:phosphoribosyl 1,2-cyclic phosphodiesterase
MRAGKAILIFDAGTGIRLLGQKLLREMPLNAQVFFSHVHWDHIQGFPFFVPAFVKGNRFQLFGGNSTTRSLAEALAGQMDHPNFPVDIGDMGAEMSFSDLAEGQVIEIDSGTSDGPIRVSNTRGNHPNGVWIYRVEYAGKSVVYATDTEHYAVVDPKICALAKDTDALIYDAMYTPEEYVGKAPGAGPSKVGWGHSTFDEGAKLAKAANVKHLYLFHHDPQQTDDDVARKEERCRALFPECTAACEGMTFEV